MPRVRIHKDVTLTTYCTLTVADQEHPIMEIVLPDGSGLFQQMLYTDALCCIGHLIHPATLKKWLEGWFKEHNEFKV